MGGGVAGDGTERSTAADMTAEAAPLSDAKPGAEAAPDAHDKFETNAQIFKRRKLATEHCSPNSFNATSKAKLDARKAAFITRPLRAGIAFSGGGIRSATISLGLTEALAANGRFYAFDMMSTVSGGGYFGSFLRSLFIEREAGNGRAENQAILKSRLAFADAVITSLPDQQYFRSSAHSSYFVKPRKNPETGAKEPQAIKNPLWWLRENGRYLAPNGMTDYLFALAFFVRNWITVMIAILAAMLLGFAILHLMMLGVNVWWPGLEAFKTAAAAAGNGHIPWSPLLALMPLGLLMTGGIGLGYWFSLGLRSSAGAAALRSSAKAPAKGNDVRWMSLWWTVCGAIITYLLLMDWRDDRLAQMLEQGTMIVLLSALLSSAVTVLRREGLSSDARAHLSQGLRHAQVRLMMRLVIGLGVIVTALMIADLNGRLPTDLATRSATIGLMVAMILCLIYAFHRRMVDTVSVASDYRRMQTRMLSLMAQGVAVIGIVGLVDTLGLFVRNLSNAPDSASFARTAFTSSALLSLIAALVAKLPEWLGRSKLGVVRILKANASAAAFIAALLMLTSLAVLADLLVLKTLWKDPAWADGAKTDPTAFGLLCGGALTIILLIGRSREFLNQTALAPLYAARLSRAYLGGSNCLRLATHTPSDVTRGMVGDDISVHYYMTRQSAAPLHFINVTRNRTTGSTNSGATTDSKRTDDDPFVIFESGHPRRRLEGYESHLTLRDRKGDRMVIGPAGIRAGAEFFHWRDIVPSAKREADADKDSAANAAAEREAVEPMRLGQLCGISGAAVSSGMGRNTSLGTAMALTLANVRLGYWWRAPRRSDDGTAPTRSEPTGLGRWLHAYNYLRDELLARYDRDKPYWYLSDGGHSENSGALTLLERNCQFILVADNGQDPDSHFADLESFVRAARTDIGKEVVAASREELNAVINHSARACFLNYKADAWDAQLAAPDNEAFALLLRAKDMSLIENGLHVGSAADPSWIVWLKPTLFKGLSVDITTYGRLNPDFPQQSTANQFFDEAQWESYRRLGFAMGNQLFADPATLASELPPIFQAFMRQKVKDD